MAKSKSRSKKSKYSETEKLAYQIGRINKGLKNPNSKVAASFANGEKSVCKERKPRKTMF